MKVLRQQKTLMALLALLVVFGACKGESPTAPPVGGGSGGGSTNTGLSMTLTASNASPLVDSIVVITAVVTLNGQPAPDGTAVEFAATGGTFSATEIVTSILRTTTNGIATVQLRSTVAGAISVQAAVGNISRTVSVTFSVTPQDVPPPNTSPAITSVNPVLGVPTGGERITIIGKNFKAPVRVLFDIGAAQPVEASVVSVTDTAIEVITPSVNLGAGQQLIAGIIVITQAGTVSEQRATLASAFTFRAEVLTPRISTASPVSGPVTGGTRVTIFGDGFQAPVQVLFGAAEARIVTVDFSQIIVETPEARATSDTGSGTVVGPVSIVVRNINSQTSTTLSSGFHYTAAVDITSFRPLQGPSTGGTDVVIDGIGFLSGAVVTIGGVRATPLSVTGTRILARTGALPSPCATNSDHSVTVRNPDNGDFETFTGDAFTYVPIVPLITAVDQGIPGGNVTVTVRDPGVGPLGTGDIRFGVNDRVIIPSPNHILVGSGTQDFELTLPLTGFVFPTVGCTTGSGLAGTQLGPTELPLTFSNISNGCTATSTIIVNPIALTNPCLAPPEGSVTDPAPPGSCATPAPTTAAGASTTDNIQITNRPQSQPLNITSVVVSGPDAASFTVTPAQASNIPGGGFQNFLVTFNPPNTPVSTTDAPANATVTFTTNSPTIPTLTVCLSSTVTGTP
jgi:hypothetical protein